MPFVCRPSTYCFRLAVGIDAYPRNLVFFRKIKKRWILGVKRKPVWIAEVFKNCVCGNNSVAVYFKKRDCSLFCLAHPEVSEKIKRHYPCPRQIFCKNRN